MDQMVLTTQSWLNDTYKNNPNWVTLELTGKTGWPTIRGLIRALQIEIGISSPNGNFGPATEAACPTLKMDLNTTDPRTNRLVHLLQGAMWCKGFSPGGFTGTFGEKTKAGIIEFQQAAGLTGSYANGIADPIIIKALMDMSAFRLVSGGDSQIRTIQQRLNAKNFKKIGLYPCDGRFNRETNKALIYALQFEMGVSGANGNFGPGTESACKNSSNHVGPGSSKTELIKVAQYALYCNGGNFNPGNFSGTFDKNTENAVRTFQSFNKLSIDGYVRYSTWASLLRSCGDRDRKGTACDCSTEITQARAKALKENGYNIVGRYIAGGEWKKLKKHEAKIILDNGLRLFPIYQTSGTNASYFTASQGTKDAKAAIESAVDYGFPSYTTIYFAVDFDPVDVEISNNILSYFKQIHSVFQNENSQKYKVGVYGTRNVCESARKAGYTSSSFVSDMSYGFSGNLGFPMPSNWAFDQIATKTIGSGEGAIEIDNNIASNRDRGVSHLDNIEYEPTEKEILAYAGDNGLFDGMGLEFTRFDTRIPIGFPNPFSPIEVFGEVSLTEKLVGPYQSINLGVDPDSLSTTFLGQLNEAGVGFDFNKEDLSFSLSKLSAAQNVNKNMKYSIDINLDGSVEIIFETSMEYRNKTIYVRIIFSIKNKSSWKVMPIPIASSIGEGDPSFSFNSTFAVTIAAIILGAIEILGSRLFRQPVPA